MKVHGTVRPPGDKSISHRALMLAALAHGRSELTGLLTGEDVKSTARVLRQLGVEIAPIGEGAPVTVSGARRAAHAATLTAPRRTLHCGNSGTTARLALGLLAGQPFAARLTGDQSLRRRPMRRVTEPLRAMGAHIMEERGDGLPLTIRGGRLRGLTYTTPVASAQIKSALLFAGLTGRVPVTIREPYRSRDHTERLFVHLGLELHIRNGDVVFEPPGRPSLCPPVRLCVPGDASSAAFLVAAAVLAEGGELLIENVGVNPTRTGFLIVLERMGARVERLNLRDQGGEPVADLLVRPAALAGTEVSEAEIPSLVDEVPILAVLASRAAAGGGGRRCSARWESCAPRRATAWSSWPRTCGRSAARPRRAATISTCAARSGPRGAGWTPPGTTGWRWRSRCSARSAAPTCASRSGGRWRSAIRRFSGT